MIRRLSLAICCSLSIIASSSPASADPPFPTGDWPKLKMSMACYATSPYHGELLFVNDGIATIPAGSIWHWDLWLVGYHAGSGDLKISHPLAPQKSFQLKTKLVTSMASTCAVWRVKLIKHK
ncbi:MAG: hypothetical protein HZA66_06140 [Rhodopseudomonas palustris]|uniref:Uncharacterized protein n=1 Tax=Rhodopseudomonas palustris TaxID=1076 RepID=A0A933RXU1_RHOPL|nr:hypothetical protein [Rhodopseudomonas palustris]